jgi:hypothetical protein
LQIVREAILLTFEELEIIFFVHPKRQKVILMDEEGLEPLSPQSKNDKKNEEEDKQSLVTPKQIRRSRSSTECFYDFIRAGAIEAMGSISPEVTPKVKNQEKIEQLKRADSYDSDAAFFAMLSSSTSGQVLSQPQIQKHREVPTNEPIPKKKKKKKTKGFLKRSREIILKRSTESTTTGHESGEHYSTREQEKRHQEMELTKSANMALNVRTNSDIDVRTALNATEGKNRETVEIKKTKSWKTFGKADAKAVIKQRDGAVTKRLSLRYAKKICLLCSFFFDYQLGSQQK